MQSTSSERISSLQIQKKDNTLTDLGICANGSGEDVLDLSGVGGETANDGMTYYFWVMAANTSHF